MKLSNVTKLEDQEFVCFDTETTGVDVENDHIVEISAQIFRGHKITETFHSFVDPECPIPTEASAIHHIFESTVKNAPKADKVITELFDFIGHRIIVGHNIKFDISMVENEAKRRGLTCTLSENHCIDTLQMARRYKGTPDNKLSTIADHFGINTKGAHRADFDVAMNIEVFYRLAERLNYLNTEDLLPNYESPITIERMTFGHFKDERFKDIPENYLKSIGKWMEKKETLKPIKDAIEKELERRESLATHKKKKPSFKKEKRKVKRLPTSKIRPRRSERLAKKEL